MPSTAAAAILLLTGFYMLIKCAAFWSAFYPMPGQLMDYYGLISTTDPCASVSSCAYLCSSHVNCTSLKYTWYSMNESGVCQLSPWYPYMDWRSSEDFTTELPTDLPSADDPAQTVMIRAREQLEVYPGGYSFHMLKNWSALRNISYPLEYHETSFYDCVWICFEQLINCTGFNYKPDEALCLLVNHDTSGLLEETDGEVRQHPSNDLFYLRSDIDTCAQQSQNGTSGVLTSPNWPDNYPNHIHNCRYIINALNGSFVTLNFTMFVTESCCDTVKVQHDTNSTVLSGLYSKGIMIRTESESVSLIFYTDMSVTKRGWLLEWYADFPDSAVETLETSTEPKNCGGDESEEC